MPPEGYAQLAGGEAEDVETGKDKAEEQHSWITLFWGACKYVWPEDPWLQVRSVWGQGQRVRHGVQRLSCPVSFAWCLWLDM